MARSLVLGGTIIALGLGAGCGSVSSRSLSSQHVAGVQPDEKGVYLSGDFTVERRDGGLAITEGSRVVELLGAAPPRLDLDVVTAEDPGYTPHRALGLFWMAGDAPRSFTWDGDILRYFGHDYPIEEQGTYRFDANGQLLGVQH